LFVVALEPDKTFILNWTPIAEKTECPVYDVLTRAGRPKGDAMGLRDRVMRALINAQAKYSIPPGESKPVEPVMTLAAQLTLTFDGIKLIGTGNGAGAFASLAAMYYFTARPELQLFIKVAGVVYFVGLLAFALGLFGYLWGLITVSDFSARIAAVTDPKKIPEQVLNRAADGLIVLLAAGVGLIASLICFFVATAIGLYAVVRF
jgi:hypothetical protein